MSPPALFWRAGTLRAIIPVSVPAGSPTIVNKIALGRRGDLEAARLWRNLSVAELYEHAVRRNEAVIAAGGPLLADTGEHTGRSPKDKFVVNEPATSADVWWGSTNRPVDEVYPIVYVDGIRIKVRDKGAVTIKSAHLVIGVDVDGRKHALGCWIAEAEGAKFWHSVLTQLRNRGGAALPQV